MTTQAPPTYADGLREALDIIRRRRNGAASPPMYGAEADLERRLTQLDTTAAERGVAGTTRAATRWTVAEAAQVDDAIRTVAARVRTRYLGRLSDATIADTFTTADVWAELGEGFPVTKGIAAKMRAAERAGVIANTGRVTFNDHPRHEHAHGQRLAVWRAL